MRLTLRKLIITSIFNSSLFVVLIISINNSKNINKVNFITYESSNLPISFIIGSSFIAGSITGAFLSLIKNSK